MVFACPFCFCCYGIPVKKYDKLDGLITSCYRIAPLLVVMFCCWFFVYAFKVTNQYSVAIDDHLRLPTCTQDSPITNFNCLIISKIDSLERKVQEKVVRVSSVEHDRFRAELGTWLSIFGLLSIIAMIVVPVATYKAHYKDLEEKIQKLSSKYNKQKSKSEEIQNQIDNQEATSNETIGFIEAQRDSGSAGDMYEFLNACRLRRVKLFSDLKDIKGEKDVNFIVNQVAELLEKIDQKVLKMSDDIGILKLALNILNSINMSLGIKVSRDTGFSQSLEKKLKEEKPLTLSPAKIEEKLRDLPENLLGIYKGYYNALYSKQES